MPRTYNCPFYKWDRDGFVSCEGGRLAFRSPETKLDYIRRHCASLKGWRECSCARMLMDNYEKVEE